MKIGRSVFFTGSASSIQVRLCCLGEVCSLRAEAHAEIAPWRVGRLSELNGPTRGCAHSISAPWHRPLVLSSVATLTGTCCMPDLRPNPPAFSGRREGRRDALRRSDKRQDQELREPAR